MTITRIYGLVDPRDGKVRYVGRTIHALTVRLQGHVSQWRKDTHRDNWIECLLGLGLRPTIVCLAVVDGDGFEAEKWWIGKLKRMGLDLVNTHAGGGGSIPRTVMPEERRRRVRESNVETWRNQELRKANSDRTKLQSATPEWKEKYRDVKKRDWERLSLEQYQSRCQKISEGRKGQSTWTKLTPEQRQHRLSGIMALNRDSARQSKRAKEYWESVKKESHGR